MSSPLLLLVLGTTVVFAKIQSTVQTTSGPIKGEVTPLVRQFLSIPFAAPSDTTRWKPPQPHPGWDSVLEATSIPPGCPQQCSSNIPNMFVHPLRFNFLHFLYLIIIIVIIYPRCDMTSKSCPERQSEDCLFLNIFTPLSDDYSSTKYPVIVYIHGGGFTENYGYGLRMNTTLNVNRSDTIYVTINYRLGALGFLWDESIGITGNYGYLDQLLALQWVYDNIDFFGGDGDRIIIQGESAGAMSVSFHLLNTTSRIIKGGIMESCVNGWGRYETPTSWDDKPIKFESAIGCGNNLHSNSKQKEDDDPHRRLQCLMNANVDDIVYHQNDDNGYRWAPTIRSADGLFEDQPTALYQQGKTLNVPFIIGQNQRELGFGCNSDAEITYNQLEGVLVATFGVRNANKVLDFYNVSRICGRESVHTNCVNVSCEISTDVEVRCISRNMTASSAIAHPESKYYHYQFNRGSSFNQRLYGARNCWDVPCHTAELWYVFYAPQAMEEQLQIRFERDETELALRIGDYWTNFAEKGHDPNLKRKEGQDIIQWIPYTEESQGIMVLDVDQKYRMEMDYITDVCDFWDKLGWTWLL